MTRESRMKNWIITIAFLAVMNEQALADISTGACGSPFVQRDFGFPAVTIYYGASTSSGSGGGGGGGGAGTYRICSLNSAIQITLANSNGAQIIEKVEAQSCMDVSSSQIQVSAQPATTGKSVVYCKIG